MLPILPFVRKVRFQSGWWRNAAYALMIGCLAACSGGAKQQPVSTAMSLPKPVVVMPSPLKSQPIVSAPRTRALAARLKPLKYNQIPLQAVAVRMVDGQVRGAYLDTPVDPASQQKLITAAFIAANLRANRIRVQATLPEDLWRRIQNTRGVSYTLRTLKTPPSWQTAVAVAIANSDNALTQLLGEYAAKAVGQPLLAAERMQEFIAVHVPSAQNTVVLLLSGYPNGVDGQPSLGFPPRTAQTTPREFVTILAAVSPYLRDYGRALTTGRVLASNGKLLARNLNAATLAASGGVGVFAEVPPPEKLGWMVGKSGTSLLCGSCFALTSYTSTVAIFGLRADPYRRDPTRSAAKMLNLAAYQLLDAAYTTASLEQGGYSDAPRTNHQITLPQYSTVVRQTVLQMQSAHRVAGVRGR